MTKPKAKPAAPTLALSDLVPDLAALEAALAETDARLEAIREERRTLTARREELEREAVKARALAALVQQAQAAKWTLPAPKAVTPAPSGPAAKPAAK